MALRRKKSNDSTESNDKPTTLDRLSSLRNDITGQSAVTDLIDILIDDFGGDSEALAQERAELAAAEPEADSPDAGEPVAE